jgi:pyridoxal phosphate enzyme (YggS family)
MIPSETQTEILQRRIADNVQYVKDKIETAAAKSGRSKDDVLLVAVTKYNPVDDGTLEALYHIGCRNFAEARPQLLAEKAAYFREKYSNGLLAADSVHWHLIGQLQRNKIRKVLPAASQIHSVNDLRLAEAINRIAGELNLQCRCLLEVAISEDQKKQGFAVNELPAAVEKIAELPFLKIGGLMGMAGLNADADETRRQFSSLRIAAEELKQSGLPANVSMNELSMGMSGDFEIAVEEGATIVRIGSLLFRYC